MNVKGTKKKNQVATINIFGHQELLKDEDLLHSEDTAIAGQEKPYGIQKRV